MFEERALDTGLHDRRGFDCGVDALNDYLQRYADQHRRRGVSSVFVLTDSEDPARILGYYTLSAAEVESSVLSLAEQKRLPRYPIPCFRLGRLAVDQQEKGRGLGRLLLGCAVARCLKAREQVAAYALVVDAKDDAARQFYLHHGFIGFSDSPMSLYIPYSVGCLSEESLVDWGSAFPLSASSVGWISSFGRHLIRQRLMSVFRSCVFFGLTHQPLPKARQGRPFGLVFGHDQIIGA